jgi:predicted protein tyrosine phosphatase
VKRILFLCGRNLARSPTAEAVFARYDGVETASAGTSKDADTPLSNELVEWADIIFVMEQSHRAKLAAVFRTALKGKRVVCLDIPDDYAFMDAELIRILKAKVTRFLT